MKSTKLILNLSIIVLLATLLVFIVTLNKYGVLTGKASDTGHANLTISEAASIAFTDATCDFGSGSVNEDPIYAVIYTGNESTVNGTWTACDGLTMTNEGNVNLTVTVASSNAAADFIGGTGPSFKWIAADGGDCVGTAGLTGLTEISGTPNVCDNLTQAGTIDLDFALLIPEDAVGTKGTVITATGTAIQ